MPRPQALRAGAGGQHPWSRCISRRRRPLSQSACSRAGGVRSKEMIMTRHGSYPVDIVPPRSKYYDSGRFGRMFGKLPPFAADTPEVRAALLDIGKPEGIMDARDDLAAGPVQLIVDPALSHGNRN